MLTSHPMGLSAAHQKEEPSLQHTLSLQPVQRVGMNSNKPIFLSCHEGTVTRENGGEEQIAVATRTVHVARLF